MKVWLLEREVECFRPLRHVVELSVLNNLKISKELEDSGYNNDKMIELIKYRGFADPKYPNRIRTSDKIITIDSNIVIKIEDLKAFDMQKEYAKEIISSYKDFIKDKNSTLHKKIKNKEGINIKWIEEDLRYESRFVKKEENLFVFETKYFIYYINSNNEIQRLCSKDKEDIEKIHWLENEFEIHTVNNIEKINNEFASWLSHIVHIEPLPQLNTTTERCGKYIDSIKDKWIINPQIWKSLNISDGKLKEILINIWKEDCKENGIFTNIKNNKYEILGWKFFYVWEGLILKQILLPNKKEIYNMEIKDDYILINDTIKTLLKKIKPTLISDLTEGNLVCILPRKVISDLDFHQHSILRYNQRIEDKCYLCEIANNIIDDIYTSGYIVEGAHTEDRRKIITNDYGYIVNNKLVISVWDKTKKKKHKKKNNKPSSTIRHLEKMERLFNTIKK